ncbi:MAG: cytochrome c maturation protein CcmE [Alphaproteobacteria bacterium]
MTHRQRRLTFALASIGLAGLAVGLVLWALQDTVTYYYSPAQLAAMPVKPERKFRVGGLVTVGSVRHTGPSEVAFTLADGQALISVTFDGSLPDLFREGQGIIAEGQLAPGGVFRASSVLAKHDETYMPSEIVKTLKAEKHWHGKSGAAPAQ